MSRGKIRVIFHIHDSSITRPFNGRFEVLHSDSFDDGFLSDIKENNYLYTLSDLLNDGDYLEEVIDNSDEFGLYKEGDTIEFIADFFLEGQCGLDGEYDEQCWIENVKHRKLTKRQEAHFLPFDSIELDKIPIEEGDKIELIEPKGPVFK